jgi:hypothetical protein
MSTRSAVDRMAAQRFPSDGDLERIAPSVERRRRMDALLAEPRQPWVGNDLVVPALRRRSPVLLAFAVAAAVTIGIVVGVQAMPQRIAPATPPPPGCGTTQARDAATLLRSLADCAQAQPPLPDAPFDYLHVIQWGAGLYEGGSAEELAAMETWEWTAADGSGRQESKGPRSTSTTDRGPGERGRPTWPADVAALEAAIRADEALGRPDMPASEPDWIPAAARIATYNVVSPQQEAALLRLLATKPGITIDGPVTDRAGRPGVAVSVAGQYAGLSSRHVLIIDPATGMILGAEETVLEAGGGVLLAAPPPAPAHFTVILRTARVNATTDRP